MTCRLMGRIQIWTFAAAVTIGCGAMSRADDAAGGDSSDTPDAPEHVDLATQHAAKVNAAILAARRFEREGSWRQAAAKYSEALQLMPGNEQASRGYQQAMAMLDDRDMLHPSTAKGVGSVQQRYQEQRSRAIVEFDDGVARARQLLSQEHFTAADRAILTAQIKLRQRKQWLSQGESSDMNKRAEALISLIGDSRVNARLLADQAAKQEVQASISGQASKQATEKAKIINGNLQRVRQLQAELKYREALQVIDEILFIDPQNPAALALRDVIRTTMIYRAYSNYQQERAFGEAEVSIENQRLQHIPVRNLSGPGDRSISGLMTYPEDWPQLSHLRGTDGGYMMPPTDRIVFRTLAKTTWVTDFPTGTAFEQALNILHEALGGLEIYTDWRALELDGIDKDTELELRMNEQPMDIVLSRVLEQVGEEGNHPMWDVQDGMLVVSTKAALQKRVIPVVYDVRDLIMPVPNFENPPNLNLGGGGGGGGGGAGGGGGGGGGFGGGGGGGGGGAFGDFTELEDELLEQLIEIIKRNVDPQSWFEDAIGDPMEFSRNLVIRQTPANHVKIGRLLAQLREARSVLISVEARFLRIKTDWFEEIGVDLDLYFNTNSGLWDAMTSADGNAQLADFFITDGVGAGQPKPFVSYGSINQLDANGNPVPPANTINTGGFGGVYNADFTGVEYLANGLMQGGIPPIRLGANNPGWSPIGVVNNSLSIVESIASGAAPLFAQNLLSGSPALGFGMSYLDDIQVDLLVKATQADERSISLASPRLTFFNGQEAWISITEEEAYVAGLTAVSGSGSGAFVPQIGTIQTGVMLHLKGAASSDRRYVTLNVDFQKSELVGIATAATTGAAGGGGIGGGGASNFAAQVQLPTIKVQQLRVTTSVPDKGTALLGGYRVTEEYEVEAGVPLLSKIPYINRFFANRITATSENTLLILLRPEIILQHESEDQLFPGLTESLRVGSIYTP